MVDYEKYKEYVKRDGIWEFTMEQVHDAYSALSIYDPAFDKVDADYFEFEEQYGARDISPFSKWAHTLDYRKAYIVTIHFDYGRKLYHENRPYTSLRDIELIAESNLRAIPEFNEAVVDSEELEERLRSDPDTDITFMEQRLQLYKQEATVHARAFLCAGYIEEQLKAEMINKALKIKNW